jgi:hypothetical protein
LFFQALNQPIKIHVRYGLCAEGEHAAVSNFKKLFTKTATRNTRSASQVAAARAAGGAGRWICCPTSGVVAIWQLET